MATLSGNKVKDTYGSLLKLASNTVTSTYKAVEDGSGNVSGMTISTTGIGVDSLKWDTTPTVSASATSALFVESGDTVYRNLGTSAFSDLINLSAGTSISITGSYPNLAINNTAPDQTVTMTASTGISISGTYPNFTVTNSAPDQTVSIAGSGGIAVSGTYPSFTIDGSNVTGGVHEEMFVGVPETSYPLGAGGSTIVALSLADNTSETTSYHFGTAPAQIQRMNGGIGVENISGVKQVVYVDMSAFVDVQSPNSDITYTLERFDTSVWNSVKSVTRYKGYTGTQVDSFWGIFNLGIGEALRVVVSSASGNVILLQQTQIKFEIKETGNII